MNIIVQNTVFYKIKACVICSTKEEAASLFNYWTDHGITWCTSEWLNPLDERCKPNVWYLLKSNNTVSWTEATPDKRDFVSHNGFLGKYKEYMAYLSEDCRKSKIFCASFSCMNNNNGACLKESRWESEHSNIFIAHTGYCENNLDKRFASIAKETNKEIEEKHKNDNKNNLVYCAVHECGYNKKGECTCNSAEDQIRIGQYAHCGTDDRPLNVKYPPAYRPITQFERLGALLQEFVEEKNKSPEEIQAQKEKEEAERKERIKRSTDDEDYKPRKKHKTKWYL